MQIFCIDFGLSEKGKIEIREIWRFVYLLRKLIAEID